MHLSAFSVPVGYACGISFALAALAGCTSIGAQYVQPSSTQPAATLVPKGRDLFIHIQDEAGCYQGRTELSGGQEFRLHPGREVIVLYESHAPAGYRYGTSPAPALETVYSVCRALVSFVPQEGMQYTTTGSGGTATAVRSCDIAISRKTSDGASEAVAVKRLTLRQTSLACIRAIERR